MLDDLLFSGLLITAALYWLHIKRINELAFHATKAYCHNAEVQLLDEYVALSKLWFARDQRGKLRLLRSYQFEFSSTGNERYQGVCTMLGLVVQSIQLDAYRIE
jgi:hypothetical protein